MSTGTKELRTAIQSAEERKARQWFEGVMRKAGVDRLRERANLRESIRQEITMAGGCYADPKFVQKTFEMIAAEIGEVRKEKAALETRLEALERQSKTL